MHCLEIIKIDVLGRVPRPEQIETAILARIQNCGRCGCMTGALEQAGLTSASRRAASGLIGLLMP